LEALNVPRREWPPFELWINRTAIEKPRISHSIARLIEQAYRGDYDLAFA
jgi:hypothetical protein